MVTPPPTEFGTFSQASITGNVTPDPLDPDRIVVVPAINLEGESSDGEFGIHGETATCDEAGLELEVVSCIFSLVGTTMEEREMIMTYAGRPTAPSRSDLSYYYGQLGQEDLEMLYALPFMQQLFDVAK